MITQTRTYPQVSEPSYKFLIALVDERTDPDGRLEGDTPTARRAFVEDALAEGLAQRDASRLIDYLKRQPRVVDETTTTTEGVPDGALTPGVYELAAGEVYVVKPNRDKTRLYAKRLIEINAERLNEVDDHVKIEFVYEAGAVLKIRPEHRMDVERAKALTLRYGRCICCGRFLKAAQSVERGIGPVCIKAFRRV